MIDPIITIRIPMSFRRIQGRKTIILPDSTPMTSDPKKQIDDALVKAIARAYRWQQMLEGGEVGSLAEIARTEKISVSFVSRGYRLALLAPDIVEAILAGTLPEGVTYKRLLEDVPVEWRRQRVAVGGGKAIAE